MRNAMLSIMYDDAPSFIELLRCLTDASYVKKLLPKIKDQVVLNYWNKQVAQTSDFHKSEILDYIVSKLGIFVTDRNLRYILGQTSSTVDFANFLENKQIILLDFSGIRRQKEASGVITTILLLKLVGELKKSYGEKRKPVNLYIDEADSWPTSYITELVAENRRYNVTLTLTTNKIAGINPTLKRALLRTGSLVSFRLFTEDAKVIAPEFHNKLISPDNLCLLKKYQAYVKTLEEGNLLVEEKPVSFETNLSSREMNLAKVKEFKLESHKRYGTKVQSVEEDIQKRMG
jgi:hypothetical protein